MKNKINPLNQKCLDFSPNDVWPLLNILNEVCFGFFIDHFHKIIGDEKNNVIELMNRIAREEGVEGLVFDLNKSELNVLKNSFDEVFRQIDKWEFQTRIGISVEEANKIKEKIIPLA